VMARFVSRSKRSVSIALKLASGQAIFRTARTFPSTLGYEASGVIDAIGTGVSGLQIGERVSTIPAFSMRKYGVYGESVIVPASAVAHYPKTLSPKEGTAIWMQYITAYGPLVEYGKVKAGDFVLIRLPVVVWILSNSNCESHGAIAIATTRGNTKANAA